MCSTFNSVDSVYKTKKSLIIFRIILNTYINNDTISLSFKINRLTQYFLSFVNPLNKLHQPPSSKKLFFFFFFHIIQNNFQASIQECYFSKSCFKNLVIKKKGREYFLIRPESNLSSRLFFLHFSNNLEFCFRLSPGIFLPVNFPVSLNLNY